MSSIDHMQTNDEQAIRALVDAFVAGWNAKDGHACARPFAENADFTAVTGLRVRGRDLIARGHVEILATVFRNTTLSGTVNDIAFLRPDVAVVDATFRLQSNPPEPWLPGHASCGIVATREDGAWSIAVFRNMVPFDRPFAGPLEEKLLGKDRAGSPQ